MMDILKSISIFLLAGVCEIGGGYLVWLSLREGKPWSLGVLGGLIVICYAVVATWQTANFGRVYAAYGGIFIVMSIIWGWKVDGIIPDKYDLLGGGIALIGMLIIMYAPRTS